MTKNFSFGTMYLWQVTGLAAVLVIFHFFGYISPVNSCSSVCTCTTIPAKTNEGESADPAGGNTEDEGDIDLVQPQGRKVVCSNNPYPISSIEDISRVTTIPLDTIRL